MLFKSLIYSVLRLFHVELLGLLFFPPASPVSGRPSGGSIFAAPAPRGATLPACGPSSPGHSCSGALRPRPAGSPLRGTRAHGPSAPGRASRPLAPPPPARESPSAPPPPAAGSAAPCAREPLRSGPSGRWLRRPWGPSPGTPAVPSLRYGPAPPFLRRRFAAYLIFVRASCCF